MGPLKNIALFTILLMGCSGYAQQNDTISWSAERQLIWYDFKAKAPPSSRVAALTASGISYSFSALERTDGVEVDFRVDAFFYPNQSWYRPGLSNPLILSHEQLHFDISELYARKMRKRLEATHFSRNVKAEVKVIYREILKELSDFQSTYDEETNFSRNREQQLRWNQKIKEVLGNN